MLLLYTMTRELSRRLRRTLLAGCGAGSKRAGGLQQPEMCLIRLYRRQRALPLLAIWLPFCRIPNYPGSARYKTGTTGISCFIVLIRNDPLYLILFFCNYCRVVTCIMSPYYLLCIPPLSFILFFSISRLSGKYRNDTHYLLFLQRPSYFWLTINHHFLISFLRLLLIDSAWGWCPTWSGENFYGPFQSNNEANREVYTRKREKKSNSYNQITIAIDSVYDEPDPSKPFPSPLNEKKEREREKS